jgi:hypothetical protein
MGVQGKLENVGKAALLRAANAPILTGGQLVIAGMKLTTGFGEPEDGARFGQGGARLHGAAATLMSAQPTESWSGAGATAYSVKDVKQMTRTRAMAAADHEVHGVLATEAFQIDFHRERLDGLYNWLADVGLLTSALGLVPGVGQGLKAAADTQAVLVAVGRSSLELDQLSSEVEANAAALQQLVGRYEKVEQTADLSQTVEDQDPPAPPPPPSPEPSPEEKPEPSPEDESKDQPPEGEPTTPPPERASGSPAQFVAPPAMGGSAQAPPPAMAQVPASPARSATGAPPVGGMPSAPMGAGAAPMAPAPGIPIGLIKDAVLAALKQEAERQAADDEKDKEDGDDEDVKDEDGDGKPDEAKDDEAAGPGGGDTSQVTTPIAVTVDSENPIGPPPAPGP